MSSKFCTVQSQWLTSLSIYDLSLCNLLQTEMIRNYFYWYWLHRGLQRWPGTEAETWAPCHHNTDTPPLEVSSSWIEYLEILALQGGMNKTPVNKTKEKFFEIFRKLEKIIVVQITWNVFSQRLQLPTWQMPHNLQKTFLQVFNSSFKDLINSDNVKLGSLEINILRKK